jgi:hypothetical protein
MRVLKAAENTGNATLLAAWRYGRHELLYVCWALMEVALLAPAALAYMPWARLWPHALVTCWLLLVMLLPFNLSRLLSLAKVSVSRQQLFLALGLIILYALAIRSLLSQPMGPLDLGWIAEFVAHLAAPHDPVWSRMVALFIVLTVVWWRGIALIGRSIDTKDLGLRFRLSSLVLAPVAIGLGGRLVYGDATPFILLFFLAGLLAVALTRVEELERQRSGLAFAMRGRWLIVVAGAALLLTLAAALAGSLLSGQAMPALAGWLAPLWASLLLAATGVITSATSLTLPLFALLGYALASILRLIGPTLQRALSLWQEIFTGIPTTTPPPTLQVEAPVFGQQPRQWLALLVMLFFVLLISLALGRLYRHLRAAPQSESEIATGHSPGVLPRRRAWVQRLRRAGWLRQWQAAASIRRIYRQMCELAAAGGYPRGASETPFEYLATLSHLWPDGVADANTITRAYVRVRYGELPETSAELEEIRAAWRRLEVSRVAEG